MTDLDEVMSFVLVRCARLGAAAAAARATLDRASVFEVKDFLLRRAKLLYLNLKRTWCVVHGEEDP